MSVCYNCHSRLVRRTVIVRPIAATALLLLAAFLLIASAHDRVLALIAGLVYSLRVTCYDRTLWCGTCRREY